ncbi:SDR family NAD(P)-dependent oxidoreductase [Streptomyces sp. NPDC097610]|uniref:SDR family NAD(P)-dependent oxidoreductase n=1 Tax=Streptomyces sp. NPDC097610 TaxID=3157227 RepID=UPI003328A404
MAIVTGGARGLGRCYVDMLAEQGASVVVNDFGVELDGSGHSSTPTDETVRAIRDQGGKAVAAPFDVSTPDGGQAIVDTALDAYGRVDLIVHNAGAGSTLQQQLDIHLMGAFHVLQPLWPRLVEQEFGRVVLTTSSSALWSRPVPFVNGMPTDLGYATAKGGLIGLMHELAHLGEPHNIHVNAISPYGASRMNARFQGPSGDFGPELGAFFANADPRQVAAVVCWLLHPDCTDTHAIFQAGGGKVSRVFIGETVGWDSEPSETSIEDVVAAWPMIEDRAGYREFETGYAEQMWRVISARKRH